MIENKVLSSLLETKKDEEGERQIHLSKEVHNTYYSSIIVGVIKSVSMI
jgi:hypothetical protein